MNCLRWLERCDRGIESHSMHVCLCMLLFCVCVVLCVDSGLATGWSLVQGVLPSVKKAYETQEEARVQQRAEETLMNEWMNEWNYVNKAGEQRKIINDEMTRTEIRVFKSSFRNHYWIYSDFALIKVNFAWYVLHILCEINTQLGS
jgi:hypothetical protein